MTAVRCLLIDDEVLGRLALRQALAAHPRIEVVGECCNAAEALLAIGELAPELVFLDIQMPGMDGLELLPRLTGDALPLVVFATAHDRHALDAFDAGAFDYVLKPLDQERFDRCIERVMRRLERLPGQPPRQGAFGPPPQRLSVRTGEHIRVVPVEEIDWIAADGNYVRLHVGGDALQHRETLAGLGARLDPGRFLRIHRGVIVNLDRVRELHPLFRGAGEIVLHDGTRLPLSRRFGEQARRALGLG